MADTFRSLRVSLIGVFAGCSASLSSNDTTSGPIDDATLVDAGRATDASVAIDRDAGREGGASSGDGSVDDASSDDSGTSDSLTGDASSSSWSQPKPLVNDVGRLAIGNQVHVVGHLNGQLVHRRSSDGGTTWTTAQTIAPAAGNFPAMYGGFYATGDTLYLVTADQEMDSSAAAGGRQIRFRRSDGNGGSWSSPTAINSASSPIFRGRVAAYQNYVHFAGTSNPTSDASLWYFRSQNGGASWGAIELAPNLGAYGGGQTVAVDGATVHIAYTDANGSVGAGPTLYTRSTDNGLTWSTPVVIGESSAASSRQARVQLAAATGHVVAVWQREPTTIGGTLPADRIGYNTSSNGGATWGTPRVLPEDTGVDRNHHHIWLAPGGGLHLLWRHGDSGDSAPDAAGYKYSSDYGATWHPRTIAVDTTGTLGSNHPWAIVANAGSVHALTGPSGSMQYARRSLP